jgi:RNA polymerase sigma-70 factor (ECF subfamily)
VDQTTIERARRGDRDAQADLLRGLQDVWFRFCVSQLGSAERARDATQETALRFLRQLPTYRGQGRIESWSIGIAVNVIREHRRDAAKHSALPEAAATERAGEADSSASFGGDEIRKLKQVLDELPERQRLALVLRFFEGLSVEETAAAMGCAAGTVKATVFQALRSIRGRFEKVRRQR